MTEAQAEAVVRLQRLTALERDKLTDEILKEYEIARRIRSCEDPALREQNILEVIKKRPAPHQGAFDNPRRKTEITGEVGPSSTSRTSSSARTWSSRSATRATSSGCR